MATQSPAALQPGGKSAVALGTQEIHQDTTVKWFLLGAIGYHVVLLETVGVGQSEIEIAAVADPTIVILNPGAGDAVQAAKAGVLEVADIVAVNKADREGAEQTVRDLRAETSAPIPAEIPTATFST